MHNSIADPLRRAYAAQITAMDDQAGKVLTRSTSATCATTSGRLCRLSMQWH
jgi:hypothetical protein